MDSKTAEAVDLVERIRNEKPDKLKLVMRYMVILGYMNVHEKNGDMLEELSKAEAINKEFQRRLEAGDLTLTENEEFLSRLENAMRIE